jgi:hypothetical protein
MILWSHIIRMPLKQILLSGVPFPGTTCLAKKSLIMDIPDEYGADKIVWEDIFDFMSQASGLPHRLFEIILGLKRVRYQHLKYTTPFDFGNHVMCNTNGTPSSQAFLQIGLNTSWGRQPLIDPKG